MAIDSVSLRSRVMVSPVEQKTEARGKIEKEEIT